MLSVFFSKCIRGTVTNQKHMSRRLTVSPQKHQTSHPKRPRFAQVHTDTPLFSPTSENPAKQTGITKQTTIQTRNQKTAHKNPKKTPNNTQHKPHQNNPQKAAKQQKTDRTADIFRGKNTYVNKIRICEAGRRICAYAPNFSPFRK